MQQDMISHRRDAMVHRRYAARRAASSQDGANAMPDTGRDRQDHDRGGIQGAGVTTPTTDGLYAMNWVAVAWHGPHPWPLSRCDGRGVIASSPIRMKRIFRMTDAACCAPKMSVAWILGHSRTLQNQRSLTGA